MTTIKGMQSTLGKRLLTKAIYDALGEELTNELDANKCQLIIEDDNKHYHFTNLTPVLQAKIDLKKRST